LSGKTERVIRSAG